MASVHRTFTVTSCLGRGGFGEVYRAEMALPSGVVQPVALKMLRRDVGAMSQAAQRLNDEARALATLDHPSIVRIFDLTVLDGRTTLVTELVEGEDLSDLFRAPEPLPLRALVEIVGRIADALDAAYNAVSAKHGVPLGLIHRDIKPSNIRIGRGGEARLLDFGIARSDELTREARTQSDMLVGSPQYMAPERYLHPQPVAASDVFALGAVLLEGVTRARLFDQPIAVLASLAIDRGRFEAFVNERVALVRDPRIRDLVGRLLRFDPRSRPPAAQVARECFALADLLAGPTLGDFCRTRVWRAHETAAGDLVGRVLEDEYSEMEPYSDSRPYTPGREAFQLPRRRVPATTLRQVNAEYAPVRRRAAVVGSILFVVSGVSLLSVMALVIGQQRRTVGSTTVPVEPLPLSSPAPVAASSPPVPAPVAPLPAPPVPAPEATVRAPDAPVRAPSAPEPSPPVPAPRPGPVSSSASNARTVAPEPEIRLVRATVALDGAPTTGTLFGGGLAVDLPGDVPPGTYRLRLVRRDGSTEEFDVSVPASAGSYRIVCGTRMHTCR